MDKLKTRLFRTAFLFTLTVMTTACQAAPSGAVETTVTQKLSVPNPVVTAAAVNTSGKTSAGTVVTFAQPFLRGDVPAGKTLQAITFDGRKLPTQVDWKASNKDGSHRHGVFTVALPEMDKSERIPFGLYIASDDDSAGQTSAPNELPENLGARVVFDIDGETYSASLEKLFDSGVDRTWLSGPLVSEWQVSGPAVDASGKPQDRLWVQFYVRYYPRFDRTRLEVIVDNSWTFKPRPRDIDYGVQLDVVGQKVYSKKKLSHTDHARWRKVFWINGDPGIFVQHNLAYLKKIGVIPNYDPNLKVPGSAVDKLYNRYEKSPHGPMDAAIVNKHMGNTGGRPDIGPLPSWTVLRLLTMDPRLITVDEGVANTSGSWPIHYRDEATNRPVSLTKHPLITTHPNLKHWKKNPLPVPEHKSDTHGLSPNVSHEPSLSFVSYLLSGDYYDLEELQFWAAWNPLRTSPSYRGKDKGLMKWNQVRGQAWSLRTLGQVAYITPDDHPMKRYWNRQLQNNLEWYDKHYVNNPKANKLGFLVGRMPYNQGRGLAPWQDDFFTWAMGYLANLGFEKARPMLEYKARFPVARMTAPGFCWVDGAMYKMNVRDSEDSQFYTSLAKAYRESTSAELQQAECGSRKMARHFGKHYKKGDMVGYPWSPEGFPANMQPALAVAVDSGVPDARRAWQIFMNRTTKPDYSTYPNWAIVPESRPSASDRAN